MKQNNVISLSGGKDSTAMLLMMLERGEDIHSVIFFDTGWEFPQMYDHIDKLEEYTGQKIWRLHPSLPFEYWMLARPIRSQKNRPKIGIKKGDVYRIGNGWPDAKQRWCTLIKRNVLAMFQKAIQNSVSCIGYAKDEEKRTKAKWMNPTNTRFPLQEYGVTEANALEYCYKHGFDWGGLYEHLHRVSCFCCPLQVLGNLRAIRKHFPALWQKMLVWDSMQPDHNQGFYGYKTVHDLEGRFAEEDRQTDFFVDGIENFTP